MTDVKAPAGPKTIYCFQNGTLMFRKPNHVPQPHFILWITTCRGEKSRPRKASLFTDRAVCKLLTAETSWVSPNPAFSQLSRRNKITITTRSGALQTRPSHLTSAGAPPGALWARAPRSLRSQRAEGARASSGGAGSGSRRRQSRRHHLHPKKEERERGRKKKKKPT